MKAAMTRMGSALRGGRFLPAAGAFAALAASIAAFGGEALAQNAAECARLQQAIASRHGSSGAQAAAERQRAELARAEGSARSLGCGNRKFLFFGSEPPPQCGELNGQIARMQASLADLEARAGGGAGDLIARYNAECTNAAPRPTNFLEALFGGVTRLAAPPPQTEARIRAARGGRNPATPAAWGQQGACRSARRLLRGLRAHLRRQLLSRFLFRRREPRRQPGRGLPGVVPQRRRSALFISVRRNDRGGRIRRLASPMPICRTPANSSKATTRAALAGAGERAGRRRSPTLRRDTATKSTTSS